MFVALELLMLVPNTRYLHLLIVRSDIAVESTSAIDGAREKTGHDCEGIDVG
jgi:hypothetical protein